MVDIYYPSNEESDYVQLVKDEGKVGGTIVQYLNRTWSLNIPEVMLEHLSLISFQVSATPPPLDHYDYPICIPPAPFYCDLQTTSGLCTTISGDARYHIGGGRLG